MIGREKERSRVFLGFKGSRYNRMVRSGSCIGWGRRRIKGMNKNENTFPWFGHDVGRMENSSFAKGYTRGSV